MRLRVELTVDECDWVYSTFMHRIELLGETLELDGPDNSDSFHLHQEIAAGESIVGALRKAGYKTDTERRREESRNATP